MKVSGPRPPSDSIVMPIRRQGGDAILRIPQRTDDEWSFPREIRYCVAKNCFAGDAHGGDERVGFIRREPAPLSEG